MDLIDGMRAFSQVVATGSFTNAADRLNISKKLVSKYVAELETHLGTRLLNRTTRSLSLTEAGTMYHTGCVQLLDDLEELETSVQNQISSPKGRLHVSVPTTFGEAYIVPLIGRFREKYPDVTIDLRLNDRYVDLIDEGFDVAIRIGVLEDSSLVARKLAPAPILVCAAPDYLALNGRPESPADLKHHQCIVDTNYRSGANWSFQKGDRRITVAVSGGIAVNSARSARDIALGGCGIAFCPAFIVGEDIRNGRLVPLLSAYSESNLAIYAVYNANRNLTPKVRAFIDFLNQAFREQPLRQSLDPLSN
ncbi:MAG: LysR family transcriptional regulator [Stappiaceae bacterium]